MKRIVAASGLFVMMAACGAGPDESPATDADDLRSSAAHAKHDAGTSPDSGGGDGGAGDASDAATHDASDAGGPDASDAGGPDASDASDASADGGPTDAGDAATDAASDARASDVGSGGSGGAPGTTTGFPCAGCILDVPSSYAPSAPARLLVMLHGDEGEPSIVAAAWEPETRAAGYILFAPQCPTSQGCAGSWWRWNQDARGWLYAQIDLVEKSYNIDRSREYASGGSGGAVYLGYQSDRLSPRIAGVNFISGGFSSFTNTCPSPTFPAYVLDGSLDYLLSDATLTRDFLTACGAEVVFDELAGVDHQGALDALHTAGKGAAILGWFDARPNANHWW
jgi:hypothetical protein